MRASRFPDASFKCSSIASCDEPLKVYRRRFTSAIVVCRSKRSSCTSWRRFECVTFTAMEPSASAVDAAPVTKRRIADLSPGKLLRIESADSMARVWGQENHS